MSGLHSIQSYYPTQFDNRTFYSDVSLDHADILQTYNNLIKAHNYKAASQHLYDAVEVGDRNMDYNGAYLWNRLENIIIAIEEYATTELQETNMRPNYSNEAPTGNLVERETVWIV